MGGGNKKGGGKQGGHKGAQRQQKKSWAGKQNAGQRNNNNNKTNNNANGSAAAATAAVAATSAAAQQGGQGGTGAGRQNGGAGAMSNAAQQLRSITAGQARQPPQDDQQTQLLSGAQAPSAGDQRPRDQLATAAEVTRLAAQVNAMQSQLSTMATENNNLRAQVGRAVANTATNDEVSASGGEGKRVETVRAYCLDGLGLVIARDHTKTTKITFSNGEAIRAMRGVQDAPDRKLIGHRVLVERFNALQTIYKQEHTEIRKFLDEAKEGDVFGCEAAPYHPIFEYIAATAMLYLADIQVPYGTYLCAVTFRSESLKAVSGKVLEQYRDHPMQCPAFVRVTHKLCKHFESNAVHRAVDKQDLYGMHQMVDEFYNNREREGTLCPTCDLYHKKDACTIRFAS